MNFTPPTISKYRRTRLVAWTLSLLVWIAEVLWMDVAFTPRHQRQRGGRMSLEMIARRVKLLIISRAVEMTRIRCRRIPIACRGRRIEAPNFINALIGVRVKRALKPRCAAARIAALVHALLHIDSFAARVAKRVMRGLTRRWLAHFATAWSMHASVCGLTTPARFAADTS